VASFQATENNSTVVRSTAEEGRLDKGKLTCCCSFVMILTLLKFLTTVTIEIEALSEWERFSRQSLFGDQTFFPFDAMFDRLGSCLVKFKRRQTFN